MPDSDRPFRRRAGGPPDGRADLRAGARPESREPRFDQRLDQWLATGRQLVDGVAGARPGSRASGRPQPGGRAGGLPRPGGLGRWVEDKLDWLLEDDDGWREPWEGPAPGTRGRSSGPPGGPAGAWSSSTGWPGSSGWPGSAAEPAEFPANAWGRGPAETPFNPGPDQDPWAPRPSRASTGQGSTSPSPSSAPGPTGGPAPSLATRFQAPSDWRQDLAPPDRAGGSEFPQSQSPQTQSPQPPQRRPLEALSRRATPLLPSRPQGGERPEPLGEGAPDWPDDASFTLNRWQRPAGPDRQAPAPLPLQPSLRPPGQGSPQAGASVAQADQPWRQGPRSAAPEGAPLAAPPPAASPGRPVPRSTRRRTGA